MPTITAVFENGVLKPAEPLNLPEHAQVRITIDMLEWEATKTERLAAFNDLMRNIKAHPGKYLTRDELHERR